MPIKLRIAAVASLWVSLAAGGNNGACDTGTLADTLISFEKECCPDSDCTLLPDSCPARCATIFVPLYEACESKGLSDSTLPQILGSVGLAMQPNLPASLSKLYELCDDQYAASPECNYQGFLPIALACADYISGISKADLDVDGLSSPCFPHASD
jgi:hypothetical protein